MKRRTLFAVILAVAVAGLAAASFYCWHQRAKFWCDSQWAGVAFRRGGYRAYAITYSYGRRPAENGGWQHLWHFPKFYHTDIRPRLTRQQRLEQDQ